MLQLQDATFRSQTRQAAALAADAEKSRIDYRKSALMGFADKLVLSLAKEMESTRGACFEAIKVMNSMADIEEVRKLAEGVTKLQGQLDKMDDKRLSLQRLMFSISMKDYSSINDLDTEFRDAMKEIRPDFDRPTETA
ncbi:hypothetical protein B8W70_15530 [Pseudomonas sp. 1239]|nr:hypothetical protein B8W70_15530 [Pseudomonas sp. 1239]